VRPVMSLRLVFRCCQRAPDCRAPGAVAVDCKRRPRNDFPRGRPMVRADAGKRGGPAGAGPGVMASGYCLGYATM